MAGNLATTRSEYHLHKELVLYRQTHILVMYTVHINKLSTGGVMHNCRLFCSGHRTSSLLVVHENRYQMGRSGQKRTLDPRKYPLPTHCADICFYTLTAIYF